MSKFKLELLFSLLKTPSPLVSWNNTTGLCDCSVRINAGRLTAVVVTKRLAEFPDRVKVGADPATEAVPVTPRVPVRSMEPVTSKAFVVSS